MPGSASSAVDKALDLLEAIADSDRPQRLSELAARVGLHRATAHRVLVDLVARGWVLRAGDHYLPGPAQLRLSDAAARNSLATLCRPVMESLSAETGLMVNLQVLEAAGTRVVEVVQPERLLMIAHLRDQVLTLDRFAGPVALVAMLDDEAREPYLRAAGGTDALREELRRTAADGFALERGRHQPLIASLSRAVLSHRGMPVCALTLVGLESDFDDGSAPRPAGRAGSRDRTARRGHHPARGRRGMSTTGSPVLVLDGADTAAALDLPELLAAVRMALVAISRGTVSAPPRIAARAPTGLLGCMPAHVPGLGLAAKLVSVFDAPGAGEGHSTHFGLVAVFDEHDGRPLAIMEAGRLTALRTAATATVSLQALAPQARRIAVVGAGVQARAQLELLAAVAPSADVVVGARDPEAARALVAAFPGVRSASIRDAVRDADAVFCCTGASTPVIRRDWLHDRAHVSSVGGSKGPEVDADTVADATVYVEWPGAADQPPPAGSHELQGIGPDRVHLLGTVLEAGSPPERTGLTLFKSTGHAALDVAAAAVVHRLARERGLGRELTF